MTKLTWFCFMQDPGHPGDSKVSTISLKKKEYSCARVLGFGNKGGTFSPGQQGRIHTENQC